MQNKPALLLSLILACTAAGAEPLNYNIVEFDESVSATVPRDTMTASFVIRAEGRDRSAVNRAFTAKLRSFPAVPKAKPSKPRSSAAPPSRPTNTATTSAS